MKWNWGTKIALVFIAFCAFIIFLVAKTFQEDVALVADDYYLQEIKYQDRIDEINNAAALNYEIEVVQDAGYVEARFPAGSSVSGEIHFYRPDNQRFDRKFAFEGNARINKSDLVAGRYKMKISWSDSRQDYYTEKVILVSK